MFLKVRQIHWKKTCNGIFLPDGVEDLGPATLPKEWALSISEGLHSDL